MSSLRRSGSIYREALQQIAGSCYSSTLPRMQDRIVRRNSSSSATFVLVARWRGSGGLGWCGEEGRTGGVGGELALSF